MLSSLSRTGVAAFVLSITAGLALAQPSFTVLPSSEPGIPNARGVMARGISGNGRVVVGSSAEFVAGVERPYAWRREASGTWTRIELPMLGRTPATTQSAGRPISLSFDGDVAVGMVGPQVALNAINYGTAARWTGVLGEKPSVARLIDNPGFTLSSIATGVSADGTRAFVFAREGDSPRTLRLIDAQAGTSTLIAGPSGVVITAYMFTGNNLSAAGDRMVGMVDNVGRRWNDAGASEALELGGFTTVAIPHVISADGFVSAGWWQASGTVSEPPIMTNFPSLWYGTRRVQLPYFLATPALTTSGRVTALSRDGRVAGGVLNPRYPIQRGSSFGSTSQTIAAVWIEEELFRLDSLLTSQGVSLQNVFPRWIAGISEDGTTITGWGTRTIAGNPNYEFVSFVATITVPAACDDLDFNNDTISPDSADLDDYLAVLAGGPDQCSTGPGQCNDLDFNNDGVTPDSTDLDAFLSRLSGGRCVR